MQFGHKMDWREVMEGIFVVVFAALIVRSFVLTSYKVPTGSMAPLLNAGDFFLGSRLHGSFQIPFTRIHLNPLSISRGDVVTFRLNEDSRVIIARRVVALENDFVEIRNQTLYVNGERKRDVDSDVKEFAVKIAPGQFFAACEQNLPSCEDSITWGGLPLTQVQSKALFIWLSTGENSTFHFRTERISHWDTKNPSLI